ncbi:MAG: hypothetical protein KatS3mg001_335 [Candidatus Pacearchaeota archaeon]|nr:MAG: hypothetical protein KatS3mg001_335 [Candidatus Pacearchaeota archaeon]
MKKIKKKLLFFAVLSLIFFILGFTIHWLFAILALLIVLYNNKNF